MERGSGWYWIAYPDLRAIRVKLQVPPLRYPDFLPSLAALTKFVRLSESRIRRLGRWAMQEIRVRSSRDDKVEGGGAPLHEWRWTEIRKGNLDKSDSQPSPSTSSGRVSIKSRPIQQLIRSFSMTRGRPCTMV
jgi:hypothetical protein